MNTPFENLIDSYVAVCEGLSREEIEKTLRKYAEKWTGCISCVYSKCYGKIEKWKGNIWFHRGCQLGLAPAMCRMYTEIK